MEAVILCGGKGMRMKSDSDKLPKPLLDINGKPIIWHIMNIYSKYGIKDFILPLGYKGNLFKEYFNNYKTNQMDYKLSLKGNKIEFLDALENDWKITFVDTGIETQTAARVKKIEKFITGDKFFLTYGDGISNINIDKLLQYHNKRGRLATATGVNYQSSYGIFAIENGIATDFCEKPILDLTINGGYFVLNKQIFSYLSEENIETLEVALLKKLSEINEVSVYKHDGYWIGIDTYKDLLNARNTNQKL